MQSPLTEEASDTGFRFLQRLVLRLSAGEVLFSGEGEKLFGALLDKELVGVGGVSNDPYGASPATGRLRHFYVAQAHRRRGIGRALVAVSAAWARQHFQRLRLRTDTQQASAFYEKLGFEPVVEKDATHALMLS